jgi:transposase
LAPAYAKRVGSLLCLVEAYDTEVASLDEPLGAQLGADKGYCAVQAVPGVGPVLGAVFVAEIGDVTRFPTAQHLCSWAGLTPRHHEGDRTVVRGHVTKQGPSIVRWACIEAVVRNRGGTYLQVFSHRVAQSHANKMAGRVAAARKLLTLVYYALRDGEVRALANRG